MQKPLKPIYYINEMHDYEFKSFSKTFEFNPDLPKTRFFTLFVPKTQSINIFYIKNQETYNLGWPNKLHIHFHVLSIEKNNLCNVCN